MKHFINILWIIAILILPQQLNAQEKSITLDKALEIVKRYYTNIFEVNIFWLEEFPEQWVLFVDEDPSANWAHDCSTYYFPNTGDLAVDTVPQVEISEPGWGFPPVDEWDNNPLSVKKSVRVRAYGELESKAEDIWKICHSLSINGPIDKTDFKTLRNYIHTGQLGNVILKNATTEDSRIPEFAFCDSELTNYGSLNLQRITLPQNLETVGEYAFNACNIDFITFPASLKTIEGFSCYDWKKIQWIYSLAQTPPKCDGNAFGGTTPKSTPIYVPIGCAEAYRKAPGWRYFTTFIETDKTPTSGINEVGISQQEDAKVYWKDGALNIKFSFGTSTDTNFYTVYTTAGIKIAEGTISGDAVSIPLPRSLYIVKVNNRAYKIR